MPPVLHVAFDKLSRGSQKQLGTRHISLRDDTKRQHILQLVAKAISPAHLIKRGAAPHATAQSLIEKPPIQQADPWTDRAW